MKSFNVVHLRHRPALTEVVVVIDVIRAFTTAAAAFAAGAERIVCVEKLDQAFALRDQSLGAVLMGEEHGQRPEGFDLGNSPVEVAASDLTGAHVIQRTSNGTRGLASAHQAVALLAAAATNITATARWITEHHPHSPVTALCTGDTSEDEGCAVHLGALLRGTNPAPADLASAVRAAGAEHMGVWRHPTHSKHEGFVADLEACSMVDQYEFAMVGRLLDSTVELRPVVLRCP
ncbi:2-phosphosulfolactate phosphatase [Kribbella orskensis]|uniref:Probable 2-phosphosulfolactate phosphatase n=1 Tax=Kribbella orskensis TaxID=2512216 RepID=A0ABY2BLI3_9ACTN|nr:MULTISPECIES: 2-phosphosulfolactate phosphatase [Kribbella]TCN40136.1 2-phosphosulfolactate phosphatase [Kribbella sp. VKM Ac-2500]TCO22756.1 2-phosphosulfolactate phosphatase [Kribbella orskensis]